jgi:hypothetical protein
MLTIDFLCGRFENKITIDNDTYLSREICSGKDKYIKFQDDNYETTIMFNVISDNDETNMELGCRVMRNMITHNTFLEIIEFMREK